MACESMTESAFTHPHLDCLGASPSQWWRAYQPQKAGETPCLLRLYPNLDPAFTFGALVSCSDVTDHQHHAGSPPLPQPHGHGDERTFFCAGGA